MKRDRTLYEYETYLRDGAGTVNVATSGQGHTFPLSRRGTYRATSFSIALAGPNLLTNFQQFGNGNGELQLKLVRKDMLGVVWDRFAMKRYALGSGEWRTYGNGVGVDSAREEKSAGPNERTGYLEPTFHQDFSSLEDFPLVNWLNPGPYWISGPVAIDGDRVVNVAWALEDTPDEAGAQLDSYRVDLAVTRVRADGTTTNEVLCLTHWDAAPAPVPPLPPPKVVALDRTSATPFGVPIPEVFRKQSRDVAALTGRAPGPLVAVEARAVISFDAADRRALQLSHRDDLRLRPPGFREIAIYCAFAPEQPGEGRRSAGRFRSLRELTEFCGGISETSRPGAYNGDDLVYLTLPVYAQFSTKWREHLAASFTPAPGARNPLTLLEIRAQDAWVVYREGSDRPESPSGSIRG